MLPKTHGKIRKGILDLFQQYLNGLRKETSELDLWILREETPDEIVRIFLHAQLRIGGIEWARGRIKRLQPQE